MLYLQPKLCYCMRKRTYIFDLSKILHSFCSLYLGIVHSIWKLHVAHYTKKQLVFVQNDRKYVIFPKM